VTEASSRPWTGGEDAPSGSRHSLSPEQQLELIDRVKSLEAELAQVSATRSLTPTEQLSAEQQLLALRRSLPWRVGRVVTIPVRVFQRLGGRLRNR
jgi:hypothetical protein